MQRSFLGFCLLALLLLTNCGRHKASGSYLATFRNGVYWLQLVENEKQISGQFESVLVNERGKMESIEGSVSGVRDGAEITLSLKPAFLLPITVHASGTIAGNKLTLTGKLAGDQPQSVVLIRSGLSAFQKQLASVNEQSRSLLAAKAEAKAREQARREEQQRIADLHQLLTQMQHFHAAVEQSLPTISQREQQYRVLTSRLAEYGERERALAGNPQAALQRMQITTAISGGLAAFDGLRVRLSNGESKFRDDAEPLQGRITEAQQNCHRAPAFASSSAVPFTDL